MLNPLFLFFLAVLILRALSAPLGEISTVAPSAAYADHPFTTGFLEGYNTMDALAGLAFGIIIVNVIRSLGVSDSRQTAKEDHTGTAPAQARDAHRAEEDRLRGLTADSLLKIRLPAA